MGHYVVIGGGGYLGAHLISMLQKHGCKRRIIIVDPFPRTFKTIQFDTDFITYYKESFLDPKVLDSVLPGASAVFHLAAVGHTGLNAGNTKLIYDFNVVGTKQLVKKCKEYEVKRFLYASSVAVAFVGEPLNNVTEEETLPDPSKYLDAYSASKAEAETYVLCQSTEKFKTIALRFRAIYGPEDPNVTEKVANLIKKGMFIGLISVHGREPVSLSSSAVNCAYSFYLADEMLQRPNGLHGRVYYIMDYKARGQFSFWDPLILALGRKPPRTYIPYWLVKLFLPFYEYFCYYIAKTAPIITTFELAILSMDNTYSIERARQELGYEPMECQMSAVAKFYNSQQTEISHLVKEIRKLEPPRNRNLKLFGYFAMVLVGIALFSYIY